MKSKKTYAKSGMRKARERGAETAISRTGDAGAYNNPLTYVRHVERGEAAVGVPEHGVHGRRRLRAAPRRAAHLPHAVHHPAHLQRVPGLALHRRRPPVCRRRRGAPWHLTPPVPAPPPRSRRGRQTGRQNEAAGGRRGHFSACQDASERATREYNKRAATCAR
jgi:hypothetical protein